MFNQAEAQSRQAFDDIVTRSPTLFLVEAFVMRRNVSRHTDRDGYQVWRWTEEIYVKWAGYSHTYNTWEPIKRLRANMGDAVDLLLMSI